MVLGFQGNRDLTLLPSTIFLTNRALTLGVQLNLLTRGRATHACRLTRDCAKTYLKMDVYAYLHTVHCEGFAFTVLYSFRRFVDEWRFETHLMRLARYWNHLTWDASIKTTRRYKSWGRGSYKTLPTVVIRSLRNRTWKHISTLELCASMKPLPSSWCPESSVLLRIFTGLYA